ncbi:MAG: hypothetical protein LBT40_05915 [Deltaproteobacteria bacterium]|jgi:hypothetical protein|nr:hypothetical protein [Deltaproteobacteria bacterium]
MNQETCKKLNNLEGLNDYCNSRGASFVGMEFLCRPFPSFANISFTAFLGSVHTAVRLVPPGDPLRSDGDGGSPDVRRARELYLRARALCLCSDLGRPDRDIGSELAAEISGAGASGGTDALRWLLPASALACRIPWLSWGGVDGALLELADGGSDAPGLAEALASCAIQKFRRREVDRGDSYLSALFRAGLDRSLDGSPDPLLVFGALMLRSAEMKTPTYGPGESLRVRTGGIVNALHVSRSLPEIACAAVLPAHLLVMSKSQDRRNLLSDMGAAAKFGLPSAPSFRLAWEILEFVQSLSSKSPGEISRSILRHFEEFAEEGLLAGFAAPPGPAMGTMLFFANFLAGMMPRLNAEELEQALRAACVRRAMPDDLPPWAFTELFRSARQAKTRVFQGILMRAAADGLLGGGDAVVHAVANASCFPGPEARPLADNVPEAEEIARLAGTPDAPGPYGMRLAAGIIAADKAARTGMGRKEAFGALAALSPDFPGFVPSPEAPCGPPASGGLSRQALSESRALALYAFAVPLIPALWGPGNARSATEGLASLLKLLPDRSLHDPVFQDTILPGACFASMAGGKGMVDAFEFIAAILPDELCVRHPRLQMRALEVISFWYMYLYIDPDDIVKLDNKMLFSLPLRLLAGPLPPALRAVLVTGLVVTCGLLKNADVAETILIDNALILLPAPPRIPPGTPRPGSGQGIPGFPDRQVSWRWPAEAALLGPWEPDGDSGGPAEDSFRGGRVPEAAIDALMRGGSYTDAMGWNYASRKGMMHDADVGISFMEMSVNAVRDVPQPDQEILDAAALEGGMSRDGFGCLTERLASRFSELEAVSPEVADFAGLPDGYPRPFTVPEHWDATGAATDWESMAERTSGAFDPADGKLRGPLAETLMPVTAWIVSDADPEDRPRILRDMNMPVTAAPELKLGDGNMIATLDRVSGHPLAAAVVTFSRLGRHVSVIEWLLSDTRPWFLAGLKTKALASSLEALVASGKTELALRASGLVPLYEGSKADRVSLARIRKALAAAAGDPSSLSTGQSAGKGNPSAKGKGKRPGRGKGRGPGKGGGGRRR